MSSVVIVTLGCKQNKYESDCMARILLDNGYIVYDKMQPADIYIINSCAVTSEAEKKSRQYIAKCCALNPDCKIIVCGCAGESNIEQFEGKSNVISVIGTEGKDKILDILNNPTKSKFEIPKEYCSIVNPIKTTTRENLKIQDGCNNFCSYCLIPYLRGRSRSRALEEIVAEAKVIASRSKEIVLTGIDISSYKIDGELALGRLMRALYDIPALISLGSLEVNVVTRELLEILKDMPNFSPHFHLSLQSGCDEILTKMNRHYSSNEYYAKIELIREYFPKANITTDVIVGFAGESEEQFITTLLFVKKCKFSFVHIFPYSRREGTRAYNWEDIPMSVKKERVDRLSKVVEELRCDYLKDYIGTRGIMLAEEKKCGYWQGFSREYIKCYASGVLEQGVEYKVKFVEPYMDGMKVLILED